MESVGTGAHQPRHRPRPWQTMAHIEAMYYGGMRMATLFTFKTIVTGKITLPADIHAHEFWAIAQYQGRLR